jgi:hypothetical protein
VEDYVREHSAGSLVRSELEIYRRHFPLFVLVTLIPYAPFLVWQLFAGVSKANLAVLFLISLLNTVPITVIISDACVGNAPHFSRAWRRAFSKLTVTAVLTILASVGLALLGAVLLIVPGLVLTVWFYFAGVVAVLEQRGVGASLARSREIGKGFYWRILGLLLLNYVIFFAGTFVLGFALGFAGAEAHVSSNIIMLLSAALSAVTSPLVAIGTVLLYYDLRVRKEAYDGTRLAEDLKR